MVPDRVVIFDDSPPWRESRLVKPSPTRPPTPTPMDEPDAVSDLGAPTDVPGWTGSPLVALESTLIAQGLPWPDNLATALEAQRAVAESGAEGRTLAILEGKPRLGLSVEELEGMARRGSSRFRKAARRDLAAALALGWDAATTVSATLFLARRAGIRVMATGGLGGVHRGWTERPDLSGDLLELADAHGCVVVCSGFKSILDLPATLEALETLGVALVGYCTDDLPAFTERSSGLPVPARVETPDQIAKIVRAHRTLGLPGAIVVVQPVDQAVALEDRLAREALDEALIDAERQGVHGAALTPFLLGRLRDRTGGASLIANRRLIVDNARLAGAIAVALAGTGTD